ncbi:MAG TPA: CDP-alcohol phosphatidyltransferase family protein [Thermoanaerobaculia bacterium]|jgi:phosphatidylglycerophosphate synthase
MHVWRDRLARWFDPIARRCPLSPNAITVLALLINAVAAALMYRRFFLAAVACIVVGGLADAFDGIVARVQQKTSRYGDFLDHFADRVSDTFIVTGWLVGSAVRFELVIASIIAVGFNGYIGTQIEATWRERNYDTLGRGEFVLALIVFPLVSHILFSNGWSELAPGGFTIPEWLALLLIAFALVGILQRFRLAARLERS